MCIPSACAFACEYCWLLDDSRRKVVYATPSLDLLYLICYLAWQFFWLLCCPSLSAAQNEMKWILIIAFLGFMESKHSLPSHRHDTPCNYHVQWKVTLISSVQILSKKMFFVIFQIKMLDHHTNVKNYPSVLLFVIFQIKITTQI